MDKDQGGPAFPQYLKRVLADYGEFGYEEAEGLTVREYFAAKIIQAIISKGVSDEAVRMINAGNDRDYMRALAISAYSMADAMIEERNK